MAHFAKIGLNNTVIEVNTVDNNVLLDANGNELEANGIDFLTKLTGWSIWVKTSYNTINNKHLLGGTPLRGNYAGIGYQYDQTNDVFYAPQPYPSWILDKTTWTWTAPTPMPTTKLPNGQYYSWDESTKSWVILGVATI
jgi:hypothetical protein